MICRYMYLQGRDYGGIKCIDKCIKCDEEIVQYISFQITLKLTKDCVDPALDNPIYNALEVFELCMLL